MKSSLSTIESKKVFEVVCTLFENHMRSGMYLSKEFHKQYGFIGLQTYGQTHLKQEGINAR
jgi:hypothetical protein